MITVYVWNYRGMDVAWGHAAMRVEGGTGTPDSVYISWWPQGSGRQAKIPRAPGFLRNVYSVKAIMGRTFEDDVRDEGSRPDHIIILKGLDEGAAKKYWSDLVRSHNPQWTTLGKNCSTTVAEALKAAGGDQYAEGIGGWWHSWNAVWKPDDVVSYAVAIRNGLARATGTP